MIMNKNQLLEFFPSRILSTNIYISKVEKEYTGIFKYYEIVDSKIVMSLKLILDRTSCYYEQYYK